MRHLPLPLLLVLFTACDSSIEPTDVAHTDEPSTDSETGSETETETQTETESEVVVLPEELEDFACFHGEQCAAEGPFLGDTCCAEGEPLRIVGDARGDEVVDLEVHDDWIVACGGFGARFSKRSDSGTSEWIGAAAERCQRATFGPVIDGGRMAYVTHHGDSWVRSPRLTTVQLMPDGDIRRLDEKDGGDVLYEGLREQDGWLYVAAHASGLRVFELDERGVPVERSSVGGFDNALKLELDGRWLYVIDGAKLHVLRIDKPGTLVRVTTAKLAAGARDITVHDGVIFVALGGWGVQRVDVSDPSKPVVGRSKSTLGSVQAVDLGPGRLAVAAWTHVELRDPDTLLLLGTRKVRPSREYEQDLGVALHGDRLYVGEWEGVHTLQHRHGVVQPDLHVAHDLLNVFGDEATSISVSLHNRGPLPLSVELSFTEDAFKPAASAFQIPPGEEVVTRIAVSTPIPEGRPAALLEISTNDPDSPKVELPIYNDFGGGLQVGDTIDETFAFLDPTGDNDIENLRGKVTVLAYFALF